MVSISILQWHAVILRHKAVTARRKDCGVQELSSLIDKNFALSRGEDGGVARVESERS
jgi:hypothetical protein